jgi:nitrate reductase assembly molybdenum cofactor insertion protein NarJ
MNGSNALPPAVADLLREASEWRLFGLVFEYPTQAWRDNLEALLTSLHSTELRALAQAALEQSSEGIHIALFGPAGSVPVREVTYQGGVQFGYLMAELSAYYDAFGYQPLVDEAADHLAVQLGFLAFLKLKQAHALLNGQSDAAHLTSEAFTSFLREHVAVQAEPVLKSLENFAPAYLAGAGELIFAHAGPSPRSGFPLGSPFDAGDESEAMSCGPSAAEDDLIQLQP